MRNALDGGLAVVLTMRAGVSIFASTHSSRSSNRSSCMLDILGCCPFKRFEESGGNHMTNAGFYFSGEGFNVYDKTSLNRSFICVKRNFPFFFFYLKYP